MATAPIFPERPIRRVDYEKMVEAGKFQNERVELLYGTIMPMSPVGPPHAHVVNTLAEILIRHLGDRAKVHIQSPFAASDGSEPEPDVAIVPRKRYDDAHPSKAFFLIEVADTSLATDRGTKAKLYAESEVPEYWVVNVRDRIIEVYTEIADGTYQHVETHHPGAGARIRLTAFPDVEIAVSDVL